jgi:hypothetical protein
LNAGLQYSPRTWPEGEIKQLVLVQIFILTSTYQDKQNSSVLKEVMSKSSIGIPSCPLLIQRGTPMARTMRVRVLE